MLKTENTIGIIGGTFDPIHNGHLITARKVLEIRNLQKILFIPCYISPHKTRLKNSNSAHRTEMLKAAIKDFDYFGFSDYELQKGGISYTIETIKYLRNIYQNIELIIGYDNYACFDRWHKPEEILSLAKVIVMKRITEKEYIIKHHFEKNVIFADTPNIEISATEIRDRIKKGLPIDFLVPDDVKKYISKNKLYRD